MLKSLTHLQFFIFSKSTAQFNLLGIRQTFPLIMEINERPRSAIVVQNELLQSELNSASESFNKALMTFLAAQTTKYENELQFLKSEVERLRTTINDTEKAAGIKVYDANYKFQASEITAANAPPPSSEMQVAPTAIEKKDDQPPPKKQQKKGDAKKQQQQPADGSTKKKAAPAEAAADESIDIGRLDLRVGRIIEANRHPDADALYVETIDLGEENPRTVISGLVKHVPLEEMQNRLVVCLCNLKPVKMRGIESQAMVMCAASADKIEIMCVAENSAPGARIIVDGFVSRPDAVLNPKKKVWETIAVDLKVSADGKAIWRDHELLVDGKTPMTAPTLRDVQIR